MKKWIEKNKKWIILTGMAVLAVGIIYMAIDSFAQNYETKIDEAAFTVLEEEFGLDIQVLSADYYDDPEIRCEGFGKLSNEEKAAFFKSAAYLKEYDLDYIGNLYEIYTEGYDDGLIVHDGENQYYATFFDDQVYVEKEEVESDE